MKLLRSATPGFTFQLRAEEKILLFRLLRQYPLVPAAAHRLSKASPHNADDENQRLLDESLAAHRQEQQAQVQALLDDPERFSEVKGGWKFHLSAPQIEWLLQVLNDVRVGHWIALGSPDFEAGERVTINEENAVHFWLMESVAFFQQHLLKAVGAT